MSRIISQKFYIISTALGPVGVRVQLRDQYDVEDVVRNRAISQARAVQFVNTGKIIDANAQLPPGSIPSVFKGNDEELVDD